MKFRTYCEAQDSTAIHKPGPNSGFVDNEHRSFEQTVDPMISEFLKGVTAGVLNEYMVQLQPQQVAYITQKIKSGLMGARYAAEEDLAKSINNLWRGANFHSTPKMYHRDSSTIK